MYIAPISNYNDNNDNLLLKKDIILKENESKTFSLKTYIKEINFLILTILLVSAPILSFARNDEPDSLKVDKNKHSLNFSPDSLILDDTFDNNDSLKINLIDTLEIKYIEERFLQLKDSVKRIIQNSPNSKSWISDDLDWLSIEDYYNNEELFNLVPMVLDSPYKSPWWNPVHWKWFQDMKEDSLKLKQTINKKGIDCSWLYALVMSIIGEIETDNIWWTWANMFSKSKEKKRCNLKEPSDIILFIKENCIPWDWLAWTWWWQISHVAVFLWFTEDWYPVILESWWRNWWTKVTIMNPNDNTIKPYYYWKFWWYFKLNF